MKASAKPLRTKPRQVRGGAAPIALGAVESQATIKKQAYATLKEALLAGRFRPGEIVTVRSLSELLGTSAMPVREALLRLTSEGAFEDLPNRSVRVPRLTRVQVE